MFKENNLKYILILGIGFLWCSSLYLTQEQYLLNYMSAKMVNMIDMMFASFAMALGILLYMFAYKKNKDIKRIYILNLFLSLLLSIGFFLINSNIIMSIILCLICFLGSAGFGCCYHFCLVASNVDKNYRGRVFAIGYSIGSIGTYLLSLLPKNIFITSNCLYIYIPLIVMNIYLINKYGDMKMVLKNDTNGKYNRYILIISIMTLLMAIISSFSSNMIALQNINLNTGFAYSRAYYSIGLIIAGILADVKNDHFEIATLVSLFYPLLAILLFRENISVTFISSLNYIFLAFFVVFRTTTFMNLKEKNNCLIYLTGLGLCISRIIEGLLVLISEFYQISYLVLVISDLILLSTLLIIYFIIYSKNNSVSENDIIKGLSAKYKLSHQEELVLDLLIKGLSNQEIADSLFISVNTIRNHVANIYRKTGMKKKELKEKCILKTI